MSRRIEIELTSSRDDGTWTWRAAGAKQPKGVLDAGLLYSGAKAGDVMRAEADFDVEGITILSVTPPKEKAADPDRLEIVGSGRDPGPGVITTLVTKGGGRRDRDDRPRGPRDERRGPRPERGDRPRSGPEAGSGTGGERRPQGARTDRRDSQDRRGPGREDAGRPRRPEGRGVPRAEGAEGRPRREGGRPPRPSTPSGPTRPPVKRLTPATKHRDSVLETVAPEHLPIAQQVLRGGMPAVRQALATENEKAKAEGRPPVSSEPILAIAEDLLPRLKTAEWRDRAEAAAAMGDDISIRDLRSVVAGAEAAARDDETRLLASGLREALHRRVEAQRTSWVSDITTAMDESKFMRALRLTGRPPDPGVRLPADLAVKLAESAGAAMTAELTPERWLDLLEAVLTSTVRRTVKPAALPEGATPELLTAARQAAGQVPALAPLLGLAAPPPPTPVKRSLTARPSRPRPQSRPVPPPPTRPEPEAPAAEAPAAQAPAAEAPAAEAPASEAPTPEPVSTEAPEAEPMTVAESETPARTETPEPVAPVQVEAAATGDPEAAEAVAEAISEAQDQATPEADRNESPAAE